MRGHGVGTDFLAWCLLLAGAVAASAGPAPVESPARMEVSGYGFFGDRELGRMLRLLQPSGPPPTTYSANAVEDGAMMLLSQLVRDGYLKPRLTVTLTLVDGSTVVRDWDPSLEPLLPRPLAANRVRFRVRGGVLYYYRSLDFVGLQGMTAKKARPLFVKGGFLVPLKSPRVFTPARLDQSLTGLRSELARRGFERADVRVGRLTRDDRSGAVDVEVVVHEGVRVRVRCVTVQVFEPGEATPKVTETRTPVVPYSRYWLQDLIRELKGEQYRHGFPDVTVEVTELARHPEPDGEQLDLLAKVQTGPHIQIGRVRFEGSQKTRQTALAGRVRLKPGEDLDPLRVERSRQRLSRLGVFSEVDVNTVPEGPATRDVIFGVKEGKTIDSSLLFGYGSYEMLRGGIEVEQINLWGRAHSARLRAVQSFKSSQVGYLYNIPDLVGEEVNLFFDASTLRREEVSFVREERTAALGVERYLDAIRSDVRVLYNYQFLNAGDVQSLTSTQINNARAAALVVDVTHDRRDNPLVPRSGYKVLANVEWASTPLGGDVDYQRIEVAGSWHLELGGGRFVHLGLSHGAALTLGSTSDLPFNKRFFPGGEDSVRGFQQGQAGCRDAQGKIIGARSYVLGNVELEQMLTPTWSVVGFVDGVGTAADISDYPANEGLYAAGAGVRFQTLVGPVRLEYGRVLNPRPLDPSGTLHLSIGFPF